MKNYKTTVNEAEVAKFSAIAQKWWDENGEFRPLHKMNPVRLAYIRDSIVKYLSLVPEKKFKPLHNVKILDVGCGGGLVTIPLHNMGATVKGIDASETNIEVAKAKLDIDFEATTVEALAERGEKFDVVLALEIIEHVNDPEFFIKSLKHLVKPSGIIIISTINKTIKSLLLAKIAAEYVLRWVPVGTHSWEKFVAPSDIDAMIELDMLDIKGFKFNPLSATWSLTENTDVNFIAVYKA